MGKLIVCFIALNLISVSSLAANQAQVTALGQNLTNLKGQISQEQAQLSYDNAIKEYNAGIAKQNAGDTAGADQHFSNAMAHQEKAMKAQESLAAPKVDAALPPICAEPAQKAQSTCTMGNSNMTGQMQGAVQNASQQMASGGTEAACKAAKGVQMLAGAANAAHAGLCQGAISSCISGCGQVVRATSYSANNPQDPNHAMSKQQYDEAKEKIGQCKSLQSHVIAAGLAAMQNALMFAMSEKCQKAVTTSTPPPSGGTPPGSMDCSNPMLQSSPTCVCANNPADPVCTASSPGLGDGSFASDGGYNGDTGLKDPVTIGFDDEIAKEEAGGGGGSPSAGSSRGSGGMSGGSGAGALPPEETGAEGQGPYNTDIMSGLAGGAGSGAGGSYGRGGSGGDKGLLDSLADKFNLKGFLPSKADFKNRGLASTGADGITGPNGPSLFEKVSTRYLKKQSELLP